MPPGLLRAGVSVRLPTPSTIKQIEQVPRQAVGPNLLVFRDDRREVSGPTLKAEALDSIRSLDCASSESLVGALLRAGELECAVADTGSVPARPFEAVTSSLAEALLNPGPHVDLQRLCAVVGEAAVPDHPSLSAPEGFAYYALHPLAFADVFERLSLPRRVVVVGIRSIGTTLSAVAAAAARAKGCRTERMTARPTGHPYNRTTEFSCDQLQLVRETASGAAFLVVDEGPGLSGSSFLSVAEALQKSGVPRERITLICSHEPDFETLCADKASRRWCQFRWMAVSPAARKPEGTVEFIGGGEWRKRLFADESAWPGSWQGLERLKYLSGPDCAEPKFFKFQGLGHYGEQVIAREEKVAAAGFGPVPAAEAHGFASYPWIVGRPMSAADLSSEVIARLAEYCAFRRDAFSTAASCSPVDNMAAHNAHELGIECAIRLRMDRPVVCDGRMQPHEWLLTPQGRMLKTDSGSHGDDHFFPGPTDIGWDLAGAIVEWGMNPAQTRAFLTCYRSASGDDPARRIGDFVTAYALFRCAWCHMAGHALQSAEERSRLGQAAGLYREWAQLGGKASKNEAF